MLWKTVSVQLLSVAFIGLNGPMVLASSTNYYENIDPNDEKAMIKYGSYLFRISSCKDCHTLENGSFLGGGTPIVTAFGSFYGPNISSDKENGIGNWSNEDFIRALRRGVSPKGRNYYPTFPYSNYSKLTDKDMLAIKSYILSKPPAKEPSKKHEVKFPFNVREFVLVWKFRNFLNVKSYTEENFIKARGPYENIPSRDEQWNRGAYLVEGPLHCTQCHSPRDRTGNFKWNEWMGGALIAGEKKGAPNLTLSQRVGLGKWSAEDWYNFLSLGVNPNGSEVPGKMGKIVEDGTSLLKPTDMDAVIKYLMSLKAVESSEVQKKDKP